VTAPFDLIPTICAVSSALPRALSTPPRISGPRRCDGRTEERTPRSERHRVFCFVFEIALHELRRVVRA